MFEHHRQPLISRSAFLHRLSSYIGIAIIIVLGSLIIGILGYHFFEGLPWIGAIVNAAMILGGMGTVDKLSTSTGKLFAAFYAIYSGIVFLIAFAVIIAPVLHRFLHRFHIELDYRSSTKKD